MGGRCDTALRGILVFNTISVRVKLQLGVVCCLLIILDADSCCRYDIHERQVGELARQLGFTQVSLSSEVMPMVRIVPRGYTGIHQNSCAEISTYFKVNGYFFRGSNFCKFKFAVLLYRNQLLTLLHSERPKLPTILAFLSAIGLRERFCSPGENFVLYELIPLGRGILSREAS